MRYAIVAEVETDSQEVVADAVSTLESILPYMFDNVFVRSLNEDDLVPDNIIQL